MKRRHKPTPISAIMLTGLLSALGSAGCAQEGPLYYLSAGRCQAAWGQADAGDRFVVFQVASTDFPAGITMELLYPTERVALPDGAPVVVVLHGGFSNDVVPVTAVHDVLLPGQGLIQLYLNLPGGDGTWSSPGISDTRGPESRRATALALQYAANNLADRDGCTLAERVPVALSSLPPLIHGHSNGGNLAVATMADSDLSLPPVAGLSTFETPSSSQFVTVEVGSRDHPLPLYQQGACGLDPEQGILCQLDYANLGWAPRAEHTNGTLGAVYFDINTDGEYDAADYAVWGVRHVDGDRVYQVFSTPMTEALEDSPFKVPDLMPSRDAHDFWLTRDAARQADAAIARMPDLAAIVIGTQQDHVLGIDDHAHVSGLAAALMGAGAPWVRVNPDRAYVASLCDADLPFADNAANLWLDPGDDAEMEPDELGNDVTAQQYVTASIIELAERAWSGEWADDLDSRLGL